MTGPFQILIISADPQLAPECEAALASLPGEAAVVHRVADARQAVETARNRHPNLAVIEMGRDLARLRAVVADVAAVSPDTLSVAAFRPELFDHEVSESAMLIEALRSGIRDFLRRPVSAVDLGQLVERLSRRDARGPVRWGKLVSFISNKGGVGKSTLAVNTALGLALRYPERVLLIDTSLQMGVCAAMLDLSPTLTLTDAARERDRLDDLLIRQLATPHRSGLHLLAAPADAVEGAEVDDDLISRVLTLSRRAYDYVIVDTFPIFDSVVMSVVDSSDLVYIVLENVVPDALGSDQITEPARKDRLSARAATGRHQPLHPPQRLPEADRCGPQARPRRRSRGSVQPRIDRRGQPGTPLLDVGLAILDGRTALDGHRRRSDRAFERASRAQRPEQQPPGVASSRRSRLTHTGIRPCPSTKHPRNHQANPPPT